MSQAYKAESGKTGKKNTLYKEKKYALHVEYSCMTRVHEVRNKVEKCRKGKEETCVTEVEECVRGSLEKESREKNKGNVRVTEDDGS